MFTNIIIKLIMGMMKQYFKELDKYKKQYGEKVLLLWQCGHFFEIYALKDIKNNVYVDPNIINNYESLGNLMRNYKTKIPDNKRVYSLLHFMAFLSFIAVVTTSPSP